MKEIETELVKKGYKYIVGTDEAGRGPLAGPVVAAACYIPINVVIEDKNIKIKDSKKISEKNRDILFDLITNHPDIKYSYCITDSNRIDNINILNASLESMTKSIQDLNKIIPIDYVLVDGNKKPKNIDINLETIIMIK